MNINLNQAVPGFSCLITKKTTISGGRLSLIGWGGWTRTNACGSQSPVPYQLGYAPMVEGEGFEPSKAAPADLQSAPFGQLGHPSMICS